MARVFKNDKCVVGIMDGKIKVVWICHFSDDRIRDRIKFSKLYFKNLIYKVMLQPLPASRDFAIWVSNAIHEFERYNDIELTVVFPFLGIKGNVQRFDIQNIHYICFKSEHDNIIDYYKIRRKGYVKKKWDKNRAIISKIITQVKPDVVHVIGAENPYYSIAALDVPQAIPCVTSLQTLISTPDFFENYPVSKELYNYRSELEKQIIIRSDYIATCVEGFKSYIKKNIKPDAIFLQMSLAVGEEINTSFDKKEYDFVYFAANINKASDLAIEAFAIAHSCQPSITINISGSYDDKYKEQLEKRLGELGIKDSVFFTGPQPTHEDVLRQIKKSKYALLPLKVDQISGTIREAMACGLPVVSTITQATPFLNEERESILLSDLGNHQAMAANMLKLISDEKYAAKLSKNAIITVTERYGNEGLMKNWKRAYYQIIDNFKNGTPFSDDILSK